MSPPSSGANAPEAARALYRDLLLKVAYVAVRELKQYERHARTHDDRQIEQIKASIAAFGFVSPLIVDQDHVLIAGHARLLAAEALGFDRVPVLRLDHLSQADAAALRIADNRLAELAGWDKSILAIEFSHLADLDCTLDLAFDLSITGFALPEIDQIIQQADAGDDKDESTPDMDVRGPVVSRLDDVWVLGEHRILCGDSCSEASYRRLMQDERAAAGFHDSPYNVSIQRHVSRSGKHAEFVMGVGEMSADEFTAFNARWLAHAAAVSAPGAIQFACMDWRHMREMLDAGRAAKLDLLNLTIWNKGAGAMGSLYRSQHELVFVWKEPNGAHTNNVQLGKFGRNRTNVWAYPRAAGLRRELELHPTPKPVALVADAIRDVTHRGDLVLDCFSGSGTTIIAAAKTGRRARVIELDPHYVDVAVRRWEAWSGQSATHGVTGLSFADTAAQRRVAVEPRSSETAPPSSQPAAPTVRVRRRVPATS
jgi:DNA modification methylase